MRATLVSLSLGLCVMASLSANAGLLPERVEKAARERIAAGTNQTLVFGVVDGEKSEIVAFGTLADGTAPDGDTVYEIGSVTKTFTATLLARAVLSGRVTLDTPVARLLPDFKIPSRGGREITLGDLATHHSGLPPRPLNMLPKDQAQSLRSLRYGAAQGLPCALRAAARSGRGFRILGCGLRSVGPRTGAVGAHELCRRGRRNNPQATGHDDERHRVHRTPCAPISFPVMTRPTSRR